MHTNRPFITMQLNLFFCSNIYIYIYIYENHQIENYNRIIIIWINKIFLLSLFNMFVAPWILSWLCVVVALRARQFLDSFLAMCGYSLACSSVFDAWSSCRCVQPQRQSSLFFWRSRTTCNARAAQNDDNDASMMMMRPTLNHKSKNKANRYKHKQNISSVCISTSFFTLLTDVYIRGRRCSPASSINK